MGLIKVNPATASWKCNPASANGKLYAGGSNAVLKDWPFSSATPTTLADVSGCGNTGTLQGAPTVTKLTNGPWYYTFDGSTQYISIADTMGLNITARPLTLMAWIKLAADAATCHIICRNVDAVANVQYALAWIGTGYLQSILEGANRGASAAGSVGVSAWKMVGATWLADGTTQCYVNGAASGIAGVAYTGALTSRANIAVGRRGVASYFKGDLALPRIFPTEWTAADWLKAYNMERKYFNV